MKINRPKPGWTTANFFGPLRFVLPILLLAGCSTLPRTPVPPRVVRPLPAPSGSALAIPVEIPVDSLRRQLQEEAAKNRAITGQTPAMNGTLTVTYAIKKLRVRDTTYDTVLQTNKVNKIVRWTFIIPHWGWADKVVQAKVPRYSFSVINDGQPYTGEVIDRFIDPLTRQIDDGYTVHYEGALKDIENFSITSDKLSASFVFDWSLGADLKSPLPPDATAKGGLTAQGSSSVAIKANISVDEDGKLTVSPTENQVNPDTGSLNIPSLGRDLIPSLPLDDTVRVAEGTLLAAVSQFNLAQSAQGEFHRNGNGLVFGGNLREAFRQLKRPAMIEPNLYLDVAPSALQIGPPSGVTRAGGQFLAVPIELETPIRVAFTADKPSVYQGYIPLDLPVRVTRETRYEASVQLVGEVGLDDVTRRMGSALDAMWEKNNYLRKDCQPAPASIWETDGGRFVVSLPLRHRDGDAPFVTFYAIGVPRVVEDVSKPADPKMVELRLDQLDWNPDTKNLLDKSFPWLAGDQVLSVLQAGAKIPLNGLEAEIRAHPVLADKTGGLSLALNLKSHHVQDFTIDGNVLRVTVNATGKPSIAVK
jgi:hypothetical protein